MSFKCYTGCYWLLFAALQCHIALSSTRLRSRAGEPEVGIINASKMVHR